MTDPRTASTLPPPPAAEQAEAIRAYARQVARMSREMAATAERLMALAQSLAP